MMKAKEKTPEEMTPQEKVQYATLLLKKAVLEYLATQPNQSARSKKVREELGFTDEDAKGDHKGYLLWGVHNLLVADGSVEWKRIPKEKHKHIVLTAKTAKTEDDEAKS